VSDVSIKAVYYASLYIHVQSLSVALCCCLWYTTDAFHISHKHLKSAQAHTQWIMLTV